MSRIIACGHAKLDKEISRIDENEIQLEFHRSLPPVLSKLKESGHSLIGLEQTSNSTSLYDFRFQRRSALIVGNERTGLTEDILAKVDAVVEIPVYGLPFAHNVATATAIALYEYCRQFPNG